MTAADVAMANKHQDIASLIRESAATEPVTEDSDDLQVRRLLYTHFCNMPRILRWCHGLEVMYSWRKVYYIQCHSLAHKIIII